jgi:hypothetical protein
MKRLPPMPVHADRTEPAGRGHVSIAFGLAPVTADRGDPAGDRVAGWPGLRAAAVARVLRRARCAPRDAFGLGREA